VGVPLPGVDVDVRDGRIFVRGPSVMREYFGNAAATAAALREGWLDTGDLGFVRDGELFVSGRVKDVVILRGENHSPQEFEEALDGIAGVRPGCAVAIGLPTPEGEVLALLVEADGAANLEEIRSRVTERTGIRPDQVYLLAPGTLPRTSSGKLRRGEALRQLQSGELRPPDRVTILHIARETARSLMARLRG
jgi:acyl-CoA synthetase (AMP-forming)/AMP-acid ligase II